MACMTLFAQPMAMTTTQLEHAIRNEDAAVWQFDVALRSKSLRMSWIVVTDEEGRRRLQMQWASVAND